MLLLHQPHRQKKKKTHTRRVQIPSLLPTVLLIPVPTTCTRTPILTTPLRIIRSTNSIPTNPSSGPTTGTTTRTIRWGPASLWGISPATTISSSSLTAICVAVSPTRHWISTLGITAGTTRGPGLRVVVAGSCGNWGLRTVYGLLVRPGTHLGVSLTRLLNGWKSVVLLLVL